MYIRQFRKRMKRLPPDPPTSPLDPQPRSDKLCQTDPLPVAPPDARPLYRDQQTQTEPEVNNDKPSYQNAGCQTDAEVLPEPISPHNKGTQTDPSVAQIKESVSTDRLPLPVIVNDGERLQDEPARVLTEPEPIQTSEEWVYAPSRQQWRTWMGQLRVRLPPLPFDVVRPLRGPRPRGRGGAGQAQRDLAPVVEEQVEEAIQLARPETVSEQVEVTVQGAASVAVYDSGNVVLPHAWAHPARRHSITEAAPFRCLHPVDKQDVTSGLRRASSASDLRCLDFGYTVTRPGSWKHHIISTRAIGITASTSTPTGLSSRFELGSLEISPLVAPF